jgi:hypothetical protein
MRDTISEPMTEQRRREVVEEFCKNTGLPFTPAGAALSVPGMGGARDQAARREALWLVVLQVLAAAPVPLTARDVAARVAEARSDLLGTAHPVVEVEEILCAECGRGGSVLALSPGNGGPLDYWYRVRRRSPGGVRDGVRRGPGGVPMLPPDPGKPPVRPPGPWISIGPKQGYIIHDS